MVKGFCGVVAAGCGEDVAILDNYSSRPHCMSSRMLEPDHIDFEVGGLSPEAPSGVGHRDVLTGATRDGD
jgi:hypothetical protein